MTSDIYSVVYAPGSSGQFIRTMIIYMLLGDDKDVPFSLGNSHTYTAEYGMRRLHLPLGGYLPVTGDRYEMIHANARASDYPIAVAGGHAILMPSMYTYFNNATVVMITVDEGDAFITTANHYYKNIDPRIRSELEEQYYNSYLNCPDLTPGLSSVTQLPETEFKLLLTKVGKEMIASHNLQVATALQHWPGDKQDRMFSIKFSDITQQSEKVISVLESITGIKMSPDALRQYNRYLEQQDLFRIEHSLGN